MKLAFFVVEFPVTSETFITDQIAAMLALGHDVTVIMTKQGKGVPDARLAAARLVVLRAPETNLWRAMLQMAFRGFRGRAQFRIAAVALSSFFGGLREAAFDLAAFRGSSLGRFDAVLCHFGPAGVRASALRRGGVLDGPICTIFHGYDVSKHTVVRRFLPHYQRLFHDSDLMLPISELWRQRLLNWGALPDRVVVQHMGVDLERIAERSPEAGLHRPLRVLSVARLVEKKGLSFGIQGVRDAGTPIEYTIIGAGPQEGTLRAAAAGSSNHIRFLGAQPHSVVLAELDRTDVFLLPSVTAVDGNMEGIPVSLMEAMASGAITVATRHSANHELISDGEEGFLVDERDGAAIAAVLENVASGDLQVSTVRLAARAKIEREFDNARLNKRLEELIANVAVGSS